MQVLVLESFPFSIRYFWESDCRCLLSRISQLGRGLLVGKSMVKEPGCLLGKVGMVVEGYQEWVGSP